MKIPKKTKGYCKYCKKTTEQKISLVKTGTKRSALKHGSKERAEKRGRGRGAGNKGRYSKPAISKFKRVGAKTSKKLNLKLTCNVCNKSIIKSGSRTKKVELE